MAQTIEGTLITLLLAAATYWALRRLRFVDEPVKWELGLTLLLIVVPLSQQRQSGDPIGLAITTVSTYVWVVMAILAAAVLVFYPVHVGRLSRSRGLYRMALAGSAALWWGLAAVLAAQAVAGLDGSCGPFRTTIPTSRTTVMCEPNLVYGFLWAMLVVVLNLVTLVGAFVVRRQRPHVNQDSVPA